MPGAVEGGEGVNCEVNKQKIHTITHCFSFVDESRASAVACGSAISRETHGDGALGSV